MVIVVILAMVMYFLLGGVTVRLYREMKGRIGNPADLSTVEAAAMWALWPFVWVAGLLRVIVWVLAKVGWVLLRLCEKYVRAMAGGDAKNELPDETIRKSLVRTATSSRR